MKGIRTRICAYILINQKYNFGSYNQFAVILLFEVQICVGMIVRIMSGIVQSYQAKMTRIDPVFSGSHVENQWDCVGSK